MVLYYVNYVHMYVWAALKRLACKQSLRGALAGGREEEGELRLWNLSIYIEKADAKCLLAEMTLVMTSLLLARVFQCLFTFVLVSASRWLEEIWQLSRRGAKRQLEVNSNSRDVVASSPTFSRPSAGVPRRACSQAIKVSSLWRPWSEKYQV